MKKILSLLDGSVRDLAKKVSFPAWVPPMLAMLTHTYFSKKGWIFERKFDGERIIAYKNGNSIRLMTRNKKTANNAYPELVAALKKIGPKQCIVDGEVVAFKGKVTSFEKLQQRMHRLDGANHAHIKIYYYIFDMVYIDGYDIRALPLLERKNLIRKLLTFSDPIRRTIHRNEKGIPLRLAACKKGWEGLIAKNGDAPYQGKRSADWLKFKCFEEQELVIGGFTDPEGGRTGFGALLLGYYKNGKFMYAGKVGTGFNEDLLNLLYNQMKRLEITICPYSNFDESAKNVHWLNPKLVAELRFHSWTKDNKLRHPSFLGLRTDKDARDVGKEDESELIHEAMLKATLKKK